MYELIIKKVIRYLKKTESIYSDDYPNIWCNFITQIQEQKFFNWYEYELFLKRAIHSELTDVPITEIEKMWESEMNVNDLDSPMKDAMIDDLVECMCEKIYDEPCDSEFEDEFEVGFDNNEDMDRIEWHQEQS